MLLLSCEKIQRVPVSEAAADQAVWDQVHPKSAQREYGPEKQQRKKISCWEYTRTSDG